MSLFSERFGYSPIRNTIQIDGINDDLKSSLWNVFYNTYFFPIGNLVVYLHEIDPATTRFFILIWINYFKRTTDSVPPFVSDIKTSFKKYFFNCAWWNIYDFLEYIASLEPNSNKRQNFINNCNIVLEKELSGFRFVGGQISPITTEAEIEEIEEALDTPSQVNTHLKQALAHLSNKEKPDYRNSVKESISAVEGICKIITNNPKATLSSAINEMETKQIIKIHPDLKDGLKKIYSWTNDDEGIRHALKEDPSLDVEDAKFMLVACSAFINYLKAKATKKEIFLK